MKNRLWSKNFRLLVLGQASSLFGNLILRLALSMYMLELTGSAAVFAGILSAAVSTILLSPLGGVLADRVDRRRMMVLLDLSAGSFVLAAALCCRWSIPWPWSPGCLSPFRCWGPSRRPPSRPASRPCWRGKTSSGATRW